MAISFLVRDDLIGFIAVDAYAKTAGACDGISSHRCLPLSVRENQEKNLHFQAEIHNFAFVRPSEGVIRKWHWIRWGLSPLLSGVTSFGFERL